MTRLARYCSALALIPVTLILLLLATASYGVHPGNDIRYFARPPVVTITWGPAHGFMVQKWINIVWDSGVGLAGNVVEFPISVDTRISVRLCSFRWLRDYLHRRGLLANWTRA